jgi:thiamine pyrophosphokinase
MKKILIFANGEPNDGDMVQEALQSASDALIIAADGGARVASFFGLQAHIVIGDMDSLPPKEQKRLTQLGTTFIPYPTDKNETDLELCLKYAIQQGTTWIRIIGGIGGRFDQVLANVLLMTLPELRQCDIKVVAGKQAIRILYSGDNHLTGQLGDTLSLIPIAGDALGVTTYGLKYPLNSENLIFGLARGISNVMIDINVRIAITHGQLLCVHTVGKAE